MNRKQKNLIRNFVIIVLMLIVLINIGKCMSKSNTLISNLPTQPVYLNSSNEMLKVSDPGLTESKLKKKMDPGEYILYYDTNPHERMYATLRIVVGETKQKLNFRKHKLPSIKRSLVLETKSGADDIVLGNRNWKYSIYNSKDNELYYNMEINFSLRGNKVGETYSYTAKWWLDKSGSKKSKENIEFSASEEQNFIIYEDKLHRIELNVLTKGNTAALEVTSSFAEYFEDK
jgi:hypothetical protein